MICMRALTNLAQIHVITIRIKPNIKPFAFNLRLSKVSD